MSATALKSRVAGKLAQVLAAKHADHPRELCLEGSDSIRRINARNIEVERECTCCDTEADSTRVPRVEPGDLLRDERGSPKRQQQRRRGCPANPAFLQNERRHLKRLRHVAREPAVMLTGHDPVEAAVKGNARLIAQFPHDCSGFELIVRVQANRDRAASKGRRRQVVRYVRLCSTPNGHRLMLRQASVGVLGTELLPMVHDQESLITLVRAEGFSPQDV